MGLNSTVELASSKSGYVGKHLVSTVMPDSAKVPSTAKHLMLSKFPPLIPKQRAHAACWIFYISKQFLTPVGTLQDKPGNKIRKKIELVPPPPLEIGMVLGNHYPQTVAFVDNEQESLEDKNPHTLRN